MIRAFCAGDTLAQTVTVSRRLRQFLVGQLVEVAAEQDIVGRHPDLAADLAGDDVVVAGQDLDPNPGAGQRRDRMPALSFGGSRKAI